MLISKTVTMTITNANKRYYENIGYQNIKNGDIIEVNVGDLSKGSHSVIECSCDYCGKNITMEYKSYNKKMNQTIKKIACRECVGEKVRESNMLNYNVPSPTCLESVKQKVRKTTKEHYGVEYISQSPEIIKKCKQTALEKYGVDHISKLSDFQERLKETRLKKYGVEHIYQLPEMLQKYKNTMLDKYGVENPSQIEEVKQKKRDTMFQHYGVEYAVLSPIVREKIVNALHENQSVSTSCQQKYINNLYNMTLNYPVKYFNVDMCDVDNKLICEYDGGGHKLRVKLGEMSEEEFNQKEIIRNNIIKREGYKTFRIISAKDRLPNDNVLLDILKQAREYFKKNPNHSWIEFDIDNSCMRNAENKDGIPFNFGEVRTFCKQIS